MADKPSDEDYRRMSRELAIRHAAREARASKARDARTGEGAGGEAGNKRSTDKIASPDNTVRPEKSAQSANSAQRDPGPGVAQVNVFAPQLHLHYHATQDGSSGITNADLLRTALCVMRRPNPADVVRKNWWWAVPGWVGFTAWGIFGVANRIPIIGLLAFIACAGIYYLAWARTLRFFHFLARTVSNARAELFFAGERSIPPLLKCPFCMILPTLQESVQGNDGAPACFLCGTRLQ